MRPFAALCFAAKIDKNRFLDVVQFLDIRNSSHPLVRHDDLIVFKRYSEYL